MVLKGTTYIGLDFQKLLKNSYIYFIALGNIVTDCYCCVFSVYSLRRVAPEDKFAELQESVQ